MATALANMKALQARNNNTNKNTSNKNTSSKNTTNKNKNTTADKNKNKNTSGRDGKPSVLGGVGAVVGVGALGLLAYFGLKSLGEAVTAPFAAVGKFFGLNPEESVGVCSCCSSCICILIIVASIMRSFRGRGASYYG